MYDYFCILNERVIMEKKRYLCKILIAGRKGKTTCWYKTESPRVNQWMHTQVKNGSLRSRGLTFS